MRYKLYFITTLLIFSCNTTQAINVGDKLPVLDIKNSGALIINADGDLEYQNWSTSKLMGKKRIIQYLPGRYSEGRQNLPLNEAVFNLDHPLHCRTTTIVNFTDSIWGTQMFIEPPMKKNKFVTPLCDIVLDRTGSGLKLWGLTEKKSVTMVINEESVIEFFHEGKLNKKQIKHIVKMTNPPEVNKVTPTLHSTSPFK